MKILAIETSCDETAVSVILAQGDCTNATFAVHGDALYSQAQKHAAFGGVYPSLAKREHAANLVPLLERALQEADLFFPTSISLPETQQTYVQKLLLREERLAPALLRTLSQIHQPDIDAIAVTVGPGLEPALWVGINFARALSYVWQIPIIPVNHLEGHLVASAVTCTNEHTRSYAMAPVTFPALGLVISGGHTEFVHIASWGTYSVVGNTRDDSVGEAFDKVARLLGAPYPGGPELSRLAEKGRPKLVGRETGDTKALRPLPRPMINSGNLDFSFSGIKTAVKYQVRDLGELDDDVRARIAADFENAVTEVMLKKTDLALTRYPVHTFFLGGGVSANSYLRARLTEYCAQRDDNITLMLPARGLSTDNAVMIGMAGYLRHVRGVPTLTGADDITANGNLVL